MQRRACPAPAVGVGHARLFAPNENNSLVRVPSLVFIALLWAVGPLRQVGNLRPIVNRLVRADTKAMAGRLRIGHRFPICPTLRQAANGIDWRYSLATT